MLDAEALAKIKEHIEVVEDLMGASNEGSATAVLAQDCRKLADALDAAERRAVAAEKALAEAIKTTGVMPDEIVDQLLGQHGTPA